MKIKQTILLSLICYLLIGCHTVQKPVPQPKTYWFVSWSIPTKYDITYGSTSLEGDLMDWYVRERNAGNHIIILYAKEISEANALRFGQTQGAYGGLISTNK